MAAAAVTVAIDTAFVRTKGETEEIGFVLTTPPEEKGNAGGGVIRRKNHKVAAPDFILRLLPGPDHLLVVFVMLL